MKIYLICALASMWSISLIGQSVRFVETSLSAAINLAKQANKPIFVDTYSEYCKPCKLMEIEFRNPEVANYFNKNFINIRVDMEGQNGPDYALAHQIVFLPTLLFLSPEGNERLKIDHILNAKDLLKFGRLINGETPPVASVPVAREVVSEPKIVQPASITKPSKTKEAAPVSAQADVTVSNEDDTILHVFNGDKDDLPPPILKEEAYLRMQFMDGSHHAAAEKYLKTQSDWKTKENVVFIHDFISKMNSPKFEFMINNRTLFESVVGKENVAQTISILINKELERGYPRPNIDRAEKLYTYLNPSTAKRQATAYMLERLYDEGKDIEFINLGDSYFKSIDDVTNHQLINKYASKKALAGKSKKALKKCVALVDRAIALSDQEPLYYITLATIRIRQEKRNEALLNLQKAEKLAVANEQSDLLEKINSLKLNISKM